MQTPPWVEASSSHFFKVDKGSKIFLYCTFLLFRLPICLRVEYSGELFLDAKKVTEQKPELGRKNRSAVTDDRVRETMISYHHVNNFFCQSWSINGDLD